MRVLSACCTVALVLAACGGEEPQTQPADANRDRTFRISPDSTSLMLGADTLMTLDQLPTESLDGSVLAPTKLTLVALSPDSMRVAFLLDGTDPVGVWSRKRQFARLVTLPAGYEVGSLSWSPSGRFLLVATKDSFGVEGVTLYDNNIGGIVRHPVANALSRNGKSVRLENWIDARRLRLQVSPAGQPEAGLTHVWEPGGGFVKESHLPLLAERAPPGSLVEAGGFFSIDLDGNGTPESVALYRAPGGIPGALILRERGSEIEAQTTQPLAPPEELGFEKWKDIDQGASLHELTRLGGRPTLLLTLPATEPGLTGIALFQLGPEGLSPVRVMTPDGPVAAIFYDGISVAGSTQLGLLDLDGDGEHEIVSGTGVRDLTSLTPKISWTARVYQWEDRGLVEAPQLEPAAIQAIERAMAES